MSAAGFSRSQILAPVLAAAAVVMTATYFCSLYLMPFCQRLVKDKEIDIRADIGAAILNEGQFNTPAKGLTVFMRELSPDGQLRGILVHDERDRLRPTTYLAESGILAQTPIGARLIMVDGTIEQGTVAGLCRGNAATATPVGRSKLPKCAPGSSFATPSLSVLKFKRYVFDLDQFAGRRQDEGFRASERYLGELLWPQSAKPLRPDTLKLFFAEANNRLAAPLYCLAFGLIAFAAVALGRRARGAYALRLGVASVIAVSLRIAGYGVQGIAAREPLFCALFYLIPIAAAAAVLAEIYGFDFKRLYGLSQLHATEPAT
jgi:lipopolysaccharide export system permease protein